MKTPLRILRGRHWHLSGLSQLTTAHSSRRAEKRCLRRSERVCTRISISIQEAAYRESRQLGRVLSRPRRRRSRRECFKRNTIACHLTEAVQTAFSAGISRHDAACLPSARLNSLPIGSAIYCAEEASFLRSFPSKAGADGARPKSLKGPTIYTIYIVVVVVTRRGPF